MRFSAGKPIGDGRHTVPPGRIAPRGGGHGALPTQVREQYANRRAPPEEKTGIRSGTALPYTFLNRLFGAPHRGHFQVSGRSSKAVPGLTPWSVSPIAGK